MSHTFLTVALWMYFGVNFVCALALHLHAEHQAHLRHRFLDVPVHFVLLTAFAIPVLLVVTAAALFGKRADDPIRKAAAVPVARAA